MVSLRDVIKGIFPGGKFGVISRETNAGIKHCFGGDYMALYLSRDKRSDFKYTSIEPFLNVLMFAWEGKLSVLSDYEGSR